MRFKAHVGVLTVVVACSSSSTPATSAGSDGGGGGEDGGAVTCSGKPQSTPGGSCTEPGFGTSDAGDGGMPPIFCIDFTGSGQVPADTQKACNTMHFVFSPSACATANPGETLVGFCLQRCGTSEETVQYYYSSGATVAKEQCMALNNLWVAM